MSQAPPPVLECPPHEGDNLFKPPAVFVYKVLKIDDFIFSLVSFLPGGIKLRDPGPHRRRPFLFSAGGARHAWNTASPEFPIRKSLHKTRNRGVPGVAGSQRTGLSSKRNRARARAKSIRETVFWICSVPILRALIQCFNASCKLFAGKSPRLPSPSLQPQPTRRAAPFPDGGFVLYSQIAMNTTQHTSPSRFFSDAAKACTPYCQDGIIETSGSLSQRFFHLFNFSLLGFSRR